MLVAGSAQAVDYDAWLGQRVQIAGVAAYAGMCPDEVAKFTRDVLALKETDVVNFERFAAEPDLYDRYRRNVRKHGGLCREYLTQLFQAIDDLKKYRTDRTLPAGLPQLPRDRCTMIVGDISRSMGFKTLVDPATTNKVSPADYFPIMADNMRTGSNFLREGEYHAMVTYGGREGSDTCDKLKELLPWMNAPEARQSLPTAFRAIKPHGGTAFARGLGFGLARMGDCRHKRMVLIADGDEGCSDGDVCEWARQVHALFPDFQMDVVYQGATPIPVSALRGESGGHLNPAQRNILCLQNSLGARILQAKDNTTDALKATMGEALSGVEKLTDAQIVPPQGEHVLSGKPLPRPKQGVREKLTALVGRRDKNGNFEAGVLGDKLKAKNYSTDSEGTQAVRGAATGGAAVVTEGKKDAVPSAASPSGQKTSTASEKYVTPVTYGQEMKTVADIENRLTSNTYPNDTDEERVQRLEKRIFGEPSEGALFKRVQRLRDALPADKDGGLSDSVNETSTSEVRSGAHFTPAAAEGISQLPMMTSSPDPLSAEIQRATESVLRPGIYRGQGVDPATGKTRDCTVTVTYTGQWNFHPTDMVQVNAWFSDDAKPGPKGTTRIQGRTWSVAFGQPDNYSPSQTTLDYAPTLGQVKPLAVPVPVLSEDSRIAKGALEITGRQIGYRFANEPPGEVPERGLERGYQITRTVTANDSLRMVEKAFKVGAAMDRDCNLSEITIGVQNTDLHGSGSFTKENYDAWKSQAKPFAADHTMKCTGLSRDTKASSALPAHVETCQKAAPADSEPKH